MLRYDDSEYDCVSRAAMDAGLTMSGYAALAALAAARQEAPPSLIPLRGALAEVMTARTQVRRYAVNVNQAVAVLHVTGEPPSWFGDALAITAHAVASLDLAAVQLVRALR